MTKRHDLPDQYSSIVQAGIELLKPRHLPDDSHQKRSVYIYNVMLLVLIAFGLVTTILARLLGTASSNGDYMVVMASSLYVLTRMGLHRLSIYIAIGAGIIYPALISQIDPDLISNTVLISSAVIIILGTYLLTNQRVVLQVITVHGFVLMVLVLTIDDFTLSSGTSILAAYVLIAILIATVVYIHQQDMETAQARLQQTTMARKDWQNLVERLPQPILLASHKEIIYANHAMVRLLGGQYKSDVVSRTLSDFLPQKTTAHLHQENSQFTMAYNQILRKLDGTQMIVATTIRPIEYEQQLATLITWQPQTESPAQANIHNIDLADDLMFDYVYQLNIRSNNDQHFTALMGGYEAVLGTSRQTILASNGWRPFIHQDDLQQYEHQFNQLLQKGEQIMQYRVLRPDGTWRWVQDRARAILDHRGNPQYIIGVAHDVTETINLEETLQTHIVQQAVVAELGLLALSTNHIAEMLDHSVVLIQQVLAVDYSTVTMYHAQKKMFEVVADTGLYEDVPDSLMSSAAPHESGVAYAINNGETVVTLNIADEDRYTPPEIVTQKQIVSQVSVVIHGRTTPYGVLCVYHKAELEFSEDDLYFLQSIANVVGTFIESHEARQAEREQREFAEALRDATVIINSQLDLLQVFHKMLEFLAQVIPHQDASSVMLMNKDDTIQVPMTRGYPEEVQKSVQDKTFEVDHFPLLTHVVTTRKSLKLDDVREDHRWRKFQVGGGWSRSAIIVPITINQRVVGILNVVSKELSNFSDEDVERMRIFADKTGNAIINARHAEELEREVQLRTQELKRERAQLQAILDSTGDGIFYTQGDYIRYANHALANMTGYDVDDFLGQPSTMLQPEDMSQHDLMKFNAIPESVLQGETWRDEVQLERRDGTSFDAGLTVSKLDAVDTDEMHSVTIVRDISHEKELIHRQQRFIANAAHELRSPISTLNTRLYLMQRQPDQMAKHITLLDRIIKRMNRLVSDLLDVSSFEQGHVVLRKETIILQEVITSVTDIQEAEAEQKQISLELHLADDPTHVLGDATRLEQVFTNLINNAITYTPENGVITIICDTQDELVKVIIQDTGQGIAPEHLPSIFQAFFRAETKHRGTGLGLHITKDIIEMHGGDISVDSTLGEGSRFIVTLPILSPAE